jgi:hypothetical protein
VTGLILWALGDRVAPETAGLIYTSTILASIAVVAEDLDVFALSFIGVSTLAAWLGMKLAHLDVSTLMRPIRSAFVSHDVHSCPVLSIALAVLIAVLWVVARLDYYVVDADSVRRVKLGRSGSVIPLTRCYFTYSFPDAAELAVGFGAGTARIHIERQDVVVIPTVVGLYRKQSKIERFVGARLMVARSDDESNN